MGGSRQGLRLGAEESSHRFHPWYSFSPCLGKGGRYKTVCADQFSIELSHRTARIMVTTSHWDFQVDGPKILFGDKVIHVKEMEETGKK